MCVYVTQVKEEVADPECRKVAAGAYATLMRVGGEGKAQAPTPTTAEYAKKLLTDALPKAASLDAPTLDFVVSIVQSLVDHKHFDFDDWNKALVVSKQGASTCTDLRSTCLLMQPCEH